MVNLKEVGLVLRTLRIQKGISGLELSKTSKVSQATISDIENMKRSPAVDTLFKLVSAMDVTLVEFFQLIEATQYFELSEKEMELLFLIKDLNPQSLDTLIAIAKGVRDSSSTK